MSKELEIEAEKANGYAYYGKPLGEKYLAFNEGFIAGATSNSAKEYWYKQFENQKLEFAIEQLKSIKTMGFEEAFICIEIYNKVKELEQKLKEL